MLTLHPKPGIELLAVEVPEEIANPELYRVNGESIMFKWDDVKHPLNVHDRIRVDYYRGDLKQYKWPVFIATAKDITEEQAAELVERVFVNTGPSIKHKEYKCYDENEGLYHFEAVRSLFCLIRAGGGNPDTKNYAILLKQ